MRTHQPKRVPSDRPAVSFVGGISSTTSAVPMTTSTTNKRQQRYGNTSSAAQSSSGSATNTDTRSSSLMAGIHWWWMTLSSPKCIIGMIALLGTASAATFLAVGLSGARQRETDRFDRTALALVQSLQAQFEEYVTAASYVHAYCRDRAFTRAEFRELYQYLLAQEGLDFKAVQFDPNVTHADRARMEDEARAYYQEFHPQVEYRGFVGFETEIPSMLEPRSDQPFYFPIHYMEPIPGNEAAIDLDYFSHISRRQTLEFCLGEGQPGLTDRLVLVKDRDMPSRCGSIDPAYGVVLMHPGVQLETDNATTWPRDLSSIVVCIPDLLGNTLENAGEFESFSAVYVYDAADSSGAEYVFLGGARVQLPDHELEFLSETPPSEIMVPESRLKVTQFMTPTPNKVWHVVVVGNPDAYAPHGAFVILGGGIILVASLFLAFWVHHAASRNRTIHTLKAANETEKSRLILENAREAARAERELNDFIAHEVRNPVSAAMTACSFVKTAVSDNAVHQTLTESEALKIVQEDVQVIDHSLNFVGDLLRNMLDMHRAADKKLKVAMAPADVWHDVLEPTGGMLNRRGDSKVKVLMECHPKDLFVETDRLRLKQVMLNLGRNSAKFISRGYIKLAARVLPPEEGGTVELSVEDSGSGVPEEKRALLFNKFQDSLDVLSQGTGIGLFLCKNLVQLMGGEISLDDDFDSGVPGCPGTRFVIRLNKLPCDPPQLVPYSDNANGATTEPDVITEQFPSSHGIGESQGDRDSHQNPMSYLENGTNGNPAYILPDVQRVLFVDDDAMLRKLFARSIKRVAPNWVFQEAGNGEAALLLIETQSFDIIFMDMYMASVEKQLLGTETVVEMRARGIQSKIFGLSANDKEEEFLTAGADAFIFKPIPCRTDLLRAELGRLLYQEPNGDDDDCDIKNGNATKLNNNSSHESCTSTSKNKNQTLDLEVGEFKQGDILQ